MADKTSPKDVIRLLYDLQRQAEAQRQAAAPSAAPAPLLERLRAWQSQRLAHTYADLLADERYRAACRFFLDDLYGARDFSQRDQDAERLYALLRRYLPESMLRLLKDALLLNRITHRLDENLATALAGILDERDAITPQAYAGAYRVCNNYEARKAQIELLATVLEEAALGGRGPIFSIGLRLARVPAYSAGWEDLHAFLERGVAACKPMKNVGYFVETIRRRETAILENIYSAQKDAAGQDPFEIAILAPPDTHGEPGSG